MPAFADGPTSGSGPDRATMRGPAPVALVDLDDHGLGVEHLPQPADQLGDQLRGVEPAGELGRQVQQPAHPRRGEPRHRGLLHGERGGRCGGARRPLVATENQVRWVPSCSCRVPHAVASFASSCSPRPCAAARP